jgi:hypothetical protein
MKDFIKSLSRAQKQGFVDFFNKNQRMMEAVSYAVEESLNGNNEPYNRMMGVDAEEKKQKSAPYYSEDGPDPAVKAYTQRKIAEAARVEQETQMRQQQFENSKFKR